jgi:hypothetical protein
MSKLNKPRKSPNTPSLYEFAIDPQLCNRPTISSVQGAILKGMDGDVLSAEELEIWHQITGRTSYPSKRFNNVTVVGGAGGGKDSFIVVPVTLHAAFFGGYEAHLISGQTGVASIVAQDKDAARITLGYIKAVIEDSPLLMSMVDDILTDEIRLKNRILIKVYPCTMRTQRGASIVFACMNEVAYYRWEGAADSDVEVESSIRRGMRFPNARVLKVSTAYLPEGILWRDYKKGHGPQDHPTQLTFQVSTEMMWPGSAGWVAQIREEWDDPDRAARELDAVFLDAAINAFIPRQEVEACVRHTGDLPHDRKQRYFAFADPSGLTENDTWTFSIMHEDKGLIFVDILRGYDGTDEHLMAAEHEALMKEYHVEDMVLSGDAYAGTLPAKVYRTHGITYRVAQCDKSEGYFTTRKILRRRTTGDRGLMLALPNHDKLISQFARLEVDYREQGKAKVDHPKRKGSHDDYANVVSLGTSILESRHLSKKAIYNRPQGSDYSTSIYDEALDELIAWARKAGVLNKETLEWLDNGKPLTRDQQHRFRIDLVEAREKLDPSWAMRARLERAGIADLIGPGNDEPEDDEDDD